MASWSQSDSDIDENDWAFFDRPSDMSVRVAEASVVEQPITNAGPEQPAPMFQNSQAATRNRQSHRNTTSASQNQRPSKRTRLPQQGSMRSSKRLNERKRQARIPTSLAKPSSCSLNILDHTHHRTMTTDPSVDEKATSQSGLGDILGDAVSGQLDDQSPTGLTSTSTLMTLGDVTTVEAQSVEVAATTEHSKTRFRQIVSSRCDRCEKFGLQCTYTMMDTKERQLRHCERACDACRRKICKCSRLLRPWTQEPQTSSTSCLRCLSLHQPCEFSVSRKNIRRTRCQTCLKLHKKCELPDTKGLSSKA